MLPHVLLVAAFAAPFLSKPTQLPAQDKVGVTTRVFHPAAPRNWRGSEKRELRCTIWYPAVSSALETPQVLGPPDAPLFSLSSAAPDAALVPALKPLPLIVMSHGTGGSAQQMAWLGTALARAGFIAVAVDHPGNTSTEPLTPEGFLLWWERATDISNVLDGLLADPEIGPRIDRERIGAAGFSIGGYTVMELAGAQTDVSPLYDRCRKNFDAPGCSAPEMKGLGPGFQNSADLLAVTRKSSGESLARSAESFRDARIRAVFAIAPANGEVLTPESLRAIRIPVAIDVGAADPIAPPDTNANYIAASTHGARERVLTGGVAHYTFLDTCLPAGTQRLPQYCVDSLGVNRDAIHAEVAGDAVDFFRHALRIR